MAKTETETQNPKPLPPHLAATQVALGDSVRLRKPHPCGSFDWKVVRLGADIGLRCLGCDHKVLLPRSVFERRFKSYLARATTDSARPELS